MKKLCTALNSAALPGEEKENPAGAVTAAEESH